MNISYCATRNWTGCEIATLFKIHSFHKNTSCYMFYFVHSALIAIASHLRLLVCSSQWIIKFHLWNDIFEFSFFIEPMLHYRLLYGGDRLLREYRSDLKRWNFEWIEFISLRCRWPNQYAGDRFNTLSTTLRKSPT